MSGNEPYFALDIGTTAVRVVQLERSGDGWTLQRFGLAPIDIRISSSDAPDDQRRLSKVILSVISQSGIRTKNVVLGVPSSKTFVTVVEMPEMPHDELVSTLKYQADQYIPMSIDEAKVDWAVLGKTNPNATTNEVLLASVANNFVESRLDLVESLGLNVLAIEPDSIALTRSLQSGAVTGAKAIIELGDFSADIIVTLNGEPRLVRSIQTGAQAFIKAASQNLNVEQKQAEQFIYKFGLKSDKLEGQVFRAIQSTVDQFTSEVEKSIKFFATKYPNLPISSIVVSNYAMLIPGFSEYLVEKLGIQVEPGNPWQQVRVSAADQTTLAPLSAQFSVAIGLAERGV